MKIEYFMRGQQVVTPLYGGIFESVMTLPQLQSKVTEIDNMRSLYPSEEMYQRIRREYADALTFGEAALRGTV